MSDENEISWPLERDSLTRKSGLLFQIVKEVTHSETLAKKFTNGLKDTTGGWIDEGEMEEFLRYLEKQTEDPFTRTLCKKIADRLGVDFV